MIDSAIRLFIAVTISASLALAAPDFSGHWKLNAEKSKLEDPYEEERTIAFKDPELTVTVKATVDGEVDENTAKYRTDSKETRNMIDGDPLFTTGHWDGDTLVLDSQSISDTDTTEFHDRWTLSEDGKVLTVKRKQKAGYDEREFVFVFDKI